MSLQWFVVKHVPDLVRRESRNIGVILVDDGGQLALSHLVGETTDGKIDGRSVTGIGQHLVYMAWVKQWQEMRDARLGGIDGSGGGRATSRRQFLPRERWRMDLGRRLHARRRALV